MRRKWGFTLIELLIVVAIIAILAAIAVPNFLEAQVRAKVSRTQNDLRTQATALECYFVDWNSYTRDSDSSLDLVDVGPEAANPNAEVYYRCANGARQLTTPIAYMGALLTDPFVTEIALEGAGAQGYRIGSGSWSYPDASINPGDNQDSTGVFEKVGRRHSYVLIGVGPDGSRARMGYKNFPFMSMYEGGASTDLRPGKNQPLCYTDYDPTNGTASLGDVYRFGGSWRNGRFMLNGDTMGADDNPWGSPVW
ncbi:prepilin-type N-terminal cleavage/methylation domain-containing protein [bacterium]|nr:prepilin-type N-terminal cleavage/methylation domain-containing protein [bacterium]